MLSLQQPQNTPYPGQMLPQAANHPAFSQSPIFGVNSQRGMSQ